MACEFVVFLDASEDRGALEGAISALDELEALEQQMSVFREESELSVINRWASSRPVRVEPRLFDLLCQAERLHRETEGAFSLAASPLWKLWGFHRRAGTLPTEEQIQAALRQSQFDRVHLDVEGESIRFEGEGMELNLGAIGKGYALDRLGLSLVENGIMRWMIHAGGSSILARGVRADETPWRVNVPHPWRRDVSLGTVQLADRAWATSGTAQQHFFHRGKRYGHILDPRSGWPAEGVLSAMACCRSAARADALATAFFVLGEDGTNRYCDQHPDDGALLMLPGSRTGEVRCMARNLAEATWQGSAEGPDPGS